MKGKRRADSGITREIRRVIGMEARALERLGRSVNGAYAKAVRWMALCKGKVVMTGVGKSGLVAQKIASTLSSTGTPAIYLHPGEAMHGGLGTIQKSDLVVAIGKSGESDELNTLLPAIRSIGAKLIAITANPKSTLARRAGLVLETPVTEEACALNLAPTCSTTAALAVGDALAVSLMKVRNFRTEHFARYHPGGRIGKHLTLRVSDIMRGGEDNPTVRAETPISRMLVEITRQHAGAVSVVDSRGRLVGLVTDYDIRRALERGRDVLSLTTRQIMNPRPTTVYADERVARAIEIMDARDRPFNVLPVIDRRRRSVGLIQVHDLRAQGL